MNNGNSFRILDANVNRAAEGLRTLEDIARFLLNAAPLTASLRSLRHAVRKHLSHLDTHCLQARDSLEDVGLSISRESLVDDKKDLSAVTAGAFKRLQEGLRVLEETLKLCGYYPLAKEYEDLRYQAYHLEKAYALELQRYSRRLPDTDLYCLTAEEHSAGRSNLEVVAAMLEAGVQIIQYREKDKKLLYKYEECTVLRRLTQEAGATFIVNDDIHLAMAVGADGVHIGQEDLPLPQVRKLVGEKMIIGLSTHSPAQAQTAVMQGADYIGVGPLFSTKTKKDVCDPVGLEYLDYAVQHVPIPFVAIGGIKEHNITQVVQRGAKCIALVTDIVGASDIKKKIAVLRDSMNKERSL